MAQDEEVTVTGPKTVAAGIPGVTAGLAAGLREMGVVRSAGTLRRVNKVDGFDCPGCAWPEPAHRHPAEFCENGAKAVAEEATVKRVGPEFFAAHSLSDLAWRSEHWLGKQGRLTHPMLKREGADRYEPVPWDEAIGVLAAELSALDSPDQALFYTSGRTSNEAAFLYQLLARAYGTNNLPDCSNMCHESSGVALTETIGIGKGSVSLDDVHAADLIVVVGQNPGTNHPRMLTALEKAKRNGAAIVAVNPLPEAGLLRFKNPQTVRGLLGKGTVLADTHLPIRIGGDLALFQWIGRRLLEWDAADKSFVDESTTGFREYAAHVSAVDADAVAAATGLSTADIDAVARRFASAQRIIVCWAMGLTQHRDAVATIQEIVNVQLLRGMIGKEGAGLCPVRGHSNVQGDRTMGIYEHPPAWSEKLGTEFGFSVPREPGTHTVDAIRAMRDQTAKVFVGLGGNFAAATPDTAVTEAALRGCRLTAHISTKLNRSHVVTGEVALILPTLGRTERDVRGTGEQFVTVEDSMSAVHASRGRLEPASDGLLSEVAIICRLGETLLDQGIPWGGFAEDYRLVRERIARIVPGFADYEAKVADSIGFVLPHPPRDSRTFTTPSGRAVFTVSALTAIEVPEGRLLLQTLRSHDQYNTTIYGLDDRYRGIHNGRRVVLVNPDDLTELGLADGDMVDIHSEWAGDEDRHVHDFRVVSYPTARGCAAAYFPEANPLVPLDHTAKGSHTPVSKALVVRLVARSAG
ncbi:FdhF/YdeP family oxidoreductase [Phytomonospora endophytica]|uniref:Molybdopterin-dependent oxidoreductase alpha subunit n=1 Tax=Phytomonospora endophytica TaxID=714109 RepID=A0A841FPI7_9ACTN|nr:FdhF/YdeP family oxidoreductase [Phytomonospora endophytica]MBB6035472.1 molybdopterin-dependent oxidoreductase alpha subunit [Phytomonospora endophytica]GIG63775.1 formate dehydrogenase subunit alpha [Phytomonospora endophytica]